MPALMTIARKMAAEAISLPRLTCSFHSVVTRSKDEQFHDHDPEPASEHQQPLSGVFARHGKQCRQNNQYEHFMPERLFSFPCEHEAGQGILGGSHQMLGIDESGHSFLPVSFQRMMHGTVATNAKSQNTKVLGEEGEGCGEGKEKPFFRRVLLPLPTFSPL